MNEEDPNHLDEATRERFRQIREDFGSFQYYNDSFVFTLGVFVGMVIMYILTEVF